MTTKLLFENQTHKADINKGLSLVGIADCDSLVHLLIGTAMPTLQNFG
ncbi:MAG: hypothetical protein AB4426_15970 [Xenococcaceae cyanobacterium]